jgi:hypothetical protein
MEQKIIRVPSNLCATPFRRAIDEKLSKMNKEGFKLTRMYIEPAIPATDPEKLYGEPETAVMLYISGTILLIGLIALFFKKEK